VARGEIEAYLDSEKSIVLPASPVTALPGENLRQAGFGVEAV